MKKDTMSALEKGLFRLAGIILTGFIVACLLPVVSGRSDLIRVGDCYNVRVNGTDSKLTVKVVEIGDYGVKIVNEGGQIGAIPQLRKQNIHGFQVDCKFWFGKGL